MKHLHFLIYFSFLFIHLHAQHGIDPDWNQSLKAIPKFNNSSSASGSVSNNMVIDKFGRILIFYIEENGNQIKIFYTGSNDNGTNWNQPLPTEFIPASKTSGNSTLSVDIDTAGTIHAIWSSRVSKAVYYSKASALTLNWSDTVRIGRTQKSRIGFCQISTDRKNRLHAYWNEGSPGSLDTAEVYYTRSINNGSSWSLQTMVSAGESRHSAFPSGDFYGARGDTLALAWRDSIGPGNGNVEDWDVKISISTNGGINWSTPFTVAGGAGMQSDPAIVIDKNNLIHLCYHYYPLTGGNLNAQVFYGFSNNLGNTWSNGFTKISVNNIQSHLVKEAYDFENDIVWYFYKDQRDYVSPFDKRADIMAVNIRNQGTNISTQEFITDADSTEVGFHNFKVGRDGIPRAHFFILPYNSGITSLFYTQRSSIATALNENNPNYGNTLMYYPNPSSKEIHFSKPVKQLLIYNINGTLIQNITKNISSFDIQFLANGNYVLNADKTIFQLIVLH